MRHLRDMNFFISLFIFLFQLFFITTFVAPVVSSESAYLNELLRAAEEKQLYKERYWEVLLHYKKKLFNTKSLIDDPQFFLAPDGKKNPQSELEATINAFFKENTKDSEHPRCRFIARYAWLKEKLMIDESKLPKVICKDYEEAFNLINPKSAVLVFPTAHINSPASMFGHTLIRIDGTYQSKLLSHAVNYSALTEQSGGLPYAIKGIFGSFKGYFSILPYYERVTEYNDIDQRDLWEYNLNLTEEEVKKMVMHIWELKDIYSYYYFFDENCSYNLLFLLEAAQPDINLTDKFGYWVIPVDTIRVVMKNSLIKDVTYRPSKATKIKHIASLLEEELQNQTLMILNKESNPEGVLTQDTEKEKKTEILDLAAEMTQYQFSKKKITKDEYLKQFLEILNVRTQLGTADEEYKIPAPTQPEQGHHSNRLSFGIGQKGDKLFQEIKFRPAYHDLLDPDEGFVEGSHIVFGDITARYYSEDKKFKLQGFDFIDIVSLSPRDNFFKPLSWRIYTGANQKMLEDHEEHLVYQLSPGIGITSKNETIGLYYAMADADLNLSNKLKDFYAFGLGPSAGVIKKITDFWKLSLSAKAIFYELGDKHQWYKATLAQNLRLSANNSIQLHLSREKLFHTYQTEIKLNWNVYL